MVFLVVVKMYVNGGALDSPKMHHAIIPVFVPGRYVCVCFRDRCHIYLEGYRFPPNEQYQS